MVAVLHMVNGWKVYKYCNKCVPFALKKTWSFHMGLGFRRVLSCELSQSGGRRVTWNRMGNNHTTCAWVRLITQVVKCSHSWASVYFLYSHGAEFSRSVPCKWHLISEEARLLFKWFLYTATALEQILVFTSVIYSCTDHRSHIKY